MSVYKIASRYAKSLLDLAIEQGRLEQVHNDMLYCHALLKASREFVLLLKSPLITADKKISIVHQLLGEKVNPLTLSFFDIMIRKGREAYLVDIVKAFKEQYNRKKEITPVKIKTAVQPDESFIHKVIEKLKKEAGLKNVEVNTEVNPDLIGGFVIQYEDKMIDASIAKNLKELKKELSDNKYINLVYSKN
jgi:F-type H+-transporting ATPase subunit delta